ncbi:stabilization of polarity axis-domain-containing protein, partial [Zopfochytrium polystomum]
MAHAQHVFLAEFDIDRGAAVRYRYPPHDQKSPSAAFDDRLLAELMLPDGAHMREEDWTIFYLNQTSATDQDAPSLLFVQNLVWMRQVAGARRGTRMLALAVASRHPWIHVVKPLLEIALDSIFQNDRPEVLAALYDTINKLDLSLMPRLTLVEKSILRYTEDRLMFDDKFIRMEELAQYRRQHGQGEGAFSPATMAHGKDRHYFNSTIEFMRNRIAVRIPMAIYPEEIGDFSVIQLITTFSALNAINPPPPGTPQIRWKAGSPYYWHPHLDCGHLTHPIVFLLGALLTQKRVVFLGHQRPAGEVAQYVVAASSMASGGGALLSGFAERCYPYISLSALDAFQATPGLIAGVTNPIVENQHDWWDVLCNINTGRITVSPKLDVGIGVDDRIMGNERERDWMRSGFWDGDNDFVADLVTAIQNNMAELQVRQKLYDYIRRFIDVTATYEIETIGTTGIGFTAMNTGNVEVGVGTFFVDEIAKRKELAMMKNRIEGWRKSKSYLLYQKDFQTTMQRRSMKEVDLQYVVSALKRSTSLDDSTTVRMFLAL